MTNPPPPYHPTGVFERQDPIEIMARAMCEHSFDGAAELMRERVVTGLKALDAAGFAVAPKNPIFAEALGARVHLTNELEAEKMERELIALSDRANQLSNRTSRLTRHRWNRIWSNINSAIVGCREILGATAESK